MSNTGKYIVELLGSALWVRGRVGSETEKTYLSQDGRRVRKDRNIFLSPDENARERVAAVKKATEEEIAALEKRLRDARDRQRNLIIAAIENREARP